LNISGDEGIHAANNGYGKFTMSSGTVVDMPIAGKIILSGKAVINSTTYRNGILGQQLIIGSESAAIVNTTATSAPAGMFAPVNVSHIKCDGTVKATNANPEWPGLWISMRFSPGANVSYWASANLQAATKVTVMQYTDESYFGNGRDFIRWPDNDRKSYMAIIQDGYTDQPANPLDSASSWAKAGITSALAKGFVPDDIQSSYTNTITRAEFCRMAVKWLEYKLGKGIDAIVAEKGIAARASHIFSDTTDPAILAAYRLGVTAGSVAPTTTSPGHFNPNGQFTRLEAAMMIMNACGVAGMDIANAPRANFADMNQAASWAHPGINFVHANGIMSGDGTNFLPAQTYSREQSILTFNNVE
jgi:hypothetical protein